MKVITANIYDAQIENLHCITDLKKRVKKLEKALKQSNEDVQLLAELLTGANFDFKKSLAIAKEKVGE